MFCPRAGLSLQTQDSPLYPILSLPFRIFIQSIYHNVSIIWYLLLPRAFFAFTNPYRASFSRQFLLSQWPSQFLFFFFISSSIILPSPTLSGTTTFLFSLSILHAPSFSISTSQTLPDIFAHSVVVSKSLNHTTLHSTQSTTLVSSVVIFPRARRKSFFFC